MDITMSREELRCLLEVTEEGLKGIIKRNNLNIRLLEFGYELIKQYKIGRNSVYDLKQVAIDEWDQYQSHRNIRKKNEHTTYVESRLLVGMKKPRRSFLKEREIDISSTTAKRYDDMMVEDEIMIKDEIVYALFNTSNETFKEITKDDYKKWWADVGEANEQLMINKNRLTRNEITERTYDSNKTVIMNNIGKEQGEIALCYDTYKEYINSIKVLDMINEHRKRRNN